jgi:hypothetical protein
LLPGKILLCRCGSVVLCGGPVVLCGSVVQQRLQQLLPSEVLP